MKKLIAFGLYLAACIIAFILDKNYILPIMIAIIGVLPLCVVLMLLEDE
jgi:hypothetical protein